MLKIQENVLLTGVNKSPFSRTALMLFPKPFSPGFWGVKIFYLFRTCTICKRDSQKWSVRSWDSHSNMVRIHANLSCLKHISAILVTSQASLLHLPPIHACKLPRPCSWITGISLFPPWWFFFIMLRQWTYSEWLASVPVTITELQCLLRVK